MKPVSQLGRQAHLADGRTPASLRKQHPVTDWNFHVTAADFRGRSTVQPACPAGNPGQKFHSLSRGIFGGAPNFDARIEAAVFSVIAALGAWPIGQAIHAAAQLMR